MDALNVMVVDDSSLSTKRLTQLLGLLGHRVVQTARTGAEAVALYPRCLPDMVTMDIAMPDMNGIEALRRILHSYPDACIVLVSSHDMDMAVVEAVNAGAKGYVRKPVDKDQLQDVIDKAVIAPPQSRPPTQLCALVFGDVVKSSRIVADELKAHLHAVIRGRVSAIKTQCQVMFDQFTGDGFFLCGNDVSEMAEASLDLRDYFQALNWRQIGYREPVAIRIGLDLNKVTITRKNGQVIDVAGAGIDRAARIEPVVMPNQVWCSKHYFHQLEREGGTRIEATALGRKELAKESGRDELYALGWRKLRN